MAMPRPPRSLSEPSCSQGSRGTSPPELLLLWPDLAPSQLSFVLLVLTSLILGVRRPASGLRHPSQGPPCHTVTAVLRDQDKVLLLAPVFSRRTNTGKFHHHPGNTMLPLGLERGFQLGAQGLVLLSLAVVPLLDSAFSPPAAL